MGWMDVFVRSSGPLPAALQFFRLYKKCSSLNKSQFILQSVSADFVCPSLKMAFPSKMAFPPKMAFPSKMAFPPFLPFPLICFFFFHFFVPLLFLNLLFSECDAQLFLPSSQFKTSSLNDCECSSKYHPQSLPSANYQQKMLQNQFDEAKKMKALINQLNVRRKPIKVITKKEEMPSEAMGSKMELMMRKIEQTLGQLNVDKTAQKEEIGKKKEKNAKIGNGKKEGVPFEVRRAKRESEPWEERGNSVLEEPLTPPGDNEREDTSTGRCNSERIRKIIRRAKGRDAAAIKRNIQTVAERQLDAKFNVICANADFSYISNTDEFCQDKINGNTCYVFRQFERIPKFIVEEEEEVAGE